MTSVQERLKLKRVPIDTWSIKEQLCLASAVLRSGDQNWMSVSRSLRPFGEPSRPVDWFSQKSCALQYGNLLENVETPKRKKRTDKTGNEHVETPGESIMRNLTHERINELKRILQEERATYLKLKEEVALIKAGQADDRLTDMCHQIEEEKKQKEKEAESHAQWLRDRQEKKLELERAWKPPASPLRKKLQRGTSGNRRNSSQSEPSSEAESAVDSPLSEQLNVDVIGDETNEAPVVEPKPVVPTPTSPLLTSLLKSPSPAPSAQSSILHSAITSAHHRPSTSSPTIASLLHSSPSIPPPTTVSPSLKNLVTSAIGAAANEGSSKPVSSSPAAGAPTLSMLLELPPSLPGKPLPELPQPFPSTTTTTKPGEVCHPQHQEMRVRSEPGTDEPVEVVEVEQQVIREEKVEETVVKVPTESILTTPTSARAATPRPNHRINRKLFAEVEPSESKDPAAEVAEEMEVTTEGKPEAEMVKGNKQKNKEESPQKLREQGTEAKKAEDEPEPESKKQENGLAEEDIKMIMDMPVVMDSEIQEAVATEQTVTEVIEVPAAPPGDLDIFIMDSTSVGNQEEVPVVTDIKLDDDEEVVVKEEEQDEGQKDAKVNKVETKKQAKDTVEEKTANVLEGKSIDSIVAVVNQSSKQNDKFDVGKGSRIEVVAIEIPSSEMESKDADKDISFEDLEKDLHKEEVKKEDENNGKETSQHDKSNENIAEEAKEEVKEEKTDKEEQTNKEEKTKKDVKVKREEKTNKEENMDTKEKDAVIQEEVKDKKETGKSIDVKNDSKDEQKVTHNEEKKNEKEEEASKLEIDAESNEGLSQEEQQSKNVTQKCVNDLPKLKENKKQGEEMKEAQKEESGEEDEAEAHQEKDLQFTETKEEDKTATTETAAEQPSEASSANNKDWKAEEEEEDEEKKEADKSESEEVKSSPEKQKPTTTSLRAETPSTEDDKTNDAVEPHRAGPSRKRGTASTPVDSVPSSPAAPMTDEDREYRIWKKAIMLVYGRLATHKYASLFLRPITDDQAPGYSSIVHRPIDLLTIKKNIETGVTRTTAEFQRDVMLMFLNSIMYNKSSYHVHDMAREMQREGMQHIQDFLTTQMLVQVSEVPLRRETRTTEAHKRGAGSSSSGGGGGGGGSGGEHLSTPGSSSQEETEASISTPNNKRKRPDHDRNSTHKKRRGADSSRRLQHTEGDSSKQQTIDKYFKKQ